ncbi:stretch-activated Ca2+-permeable channel component-domain-containing protein [Epithele typhae]|uniref:stretch-activated Ca2+-permeable channel component-domain-containing protein n=1 Tax=Epithele typhae TaxID=378194 RepID=UPI00200722B0|nr:stretch-activated Ca2+-permeable channel component-domain-containing protein [Epithele typhae]KAH9914164.1 stretch-activated Ca2+-permeable channel component-domain-containing protein [Epithele typhae]
MFFTKSASFACTLVHQLPYCPTVAYAVPLAVPRSPQVAYTAPTLPSPVGETIVSGMSNFTSTLTTLACSRDDYSPLVTCTDCQAAHLQPDRPDVLRREHFRARNPALPAFGEAYEVLPPCLEVQCMSRLSSAKSVSRDTAICRRASYDQLGLQVWPNPPKHVAATFKTSDIWRWVSEDRHTGEHWGPMQPGSGAGPTLH